MTDKETQESRYWLTEKGLAALGVGAAERQRAATAERQQESLRHYAGRHVRPAGQP